MSAGRRVALAAAAIALALFCALVWPTRYREIRVRTSPQVLAARQDRFTGRVELLTRDGRWRRPEPVARDSLGAAIDSALEEIRGR